MLLKSIICAVVALAPICCANAAQAEPTLNFTSDKWLDSRYDWVVYLTEKELANFLKYPTCSLYPVTKVEVSYRVAPRLQPKKNELTHYEDLLYHVATPIGSRSFSKLSLSKGWQGAIVIRPASENAPTTNTAALANAIVRLLLDVSLAKCSLTVVFAEPQIEQQVCDQLGQFRFFRTHDDSIDSPGTLRFVMSSGDIRDRTFVVYSPQK
ncbi:MAG TPA: hypothetical protein V6C76_02275 [Drouetiella sp.]